MRIQDRFDPLTGNAILDALAPPERERVAAAGEVVALMRHQVLYDYDTPVGAVWFPTSGVVSWTTRDHGGHVVETAIGGREGFIGIQVLLGASSVGGHAEVQVA